jgi:hypothetical protein
MRGPGRAWAQMRRRISGGNWLKSGNSVRCVIVYFYNCKTKNECSLISTDDEGSDDTNTVLKHKRNDPT